MDYDPELIGQHAERLYRRAARIRVERTVTWAVLGFVAAFLATSVLQGVGSELSPGAGASVAGLLMGWIGFRTAGEVAFRLRLEAQNALCQVQIERNTSIQPADRTLPEGT